jgi:hypothetical protein
MKSLQEGDQSRCLRRTQVLAIRGHVAAALYDLANELIFSEPGRNGVQSWSPLASSVPERVAVPALLGLKNERTLTLKCSCVM